MKTWRRKWQPTPIFLPGKSHGQRSLVGYSPWGHKELDTTEWLHLNLIYEKDIIWYMSLWKEYLNIYIYHVSVQFSSFAQSCPTLRPHESQHDRSPCPSPTAGVHPNSCPLSRWCHPTISSSVIPFSSCPQTFPASGSFQMSQLFASGGQSIGVSASTSVLPMNTQDWSPSGWTGWLSLQYKGLSRVFSNTIVQKHQFFCAQLSSQSNSHLYMTTGKTIALTR